MQRWSELRKQTRLFQNLANNFMNLPLEAKPHSMRTRQRMPAEAEYVSDWAVRIRPLFVCSGQRKQGLLGMARRGDIESEPREKEKELDQPRCTGRTCKLTEAYPRLCQTI